MIRTPMAAQKDAIETKKKRKRIGWRKLFIHQKLEVRSMEEGFLGSWHAGTVIGCGEQTVNIKYDEILSDDGSGCLVECVKVSPVLDGLVPGIHGTSDNYRGNIRPLPPLIDFQKWSLHYGQCVDVFVQDAWWEGVISDHEDGSDERRIFFPDMGDEMMAKIEMLRITQEWDEVTEKWKRRGNWLLLELIEEVELEWPLLVSVRQIWYEIRLKMGFEKLKEWTSASRGIWKELLLQVLCTSYKLTVKQVFHELNSLGDLVEEGQQLLQFSEPALDAILKPEGIFCDSMAIVPYGTNCQLDYHATPLIDLNNISFHPAEERIAPNDFASTKLDDWLDKNSLTNSMPRPNEAWCVSDPPLSIIPPKGDSISESGSDTESQRCLTISSDKLKEKGKLKASAGRQKLLWLPAGSDVVPGPAFCPDSVSQYIKMSRSTSKCPGLSAIRLEVRKHLSHLGWNIKFKRDGRVNRMRYISPEGEIKDSLLQVCLLLQHGKDIPSTVCKDNERKNDGTAESLISSPFIETPGGAHTVPLNSHCEVVTVEPYYCPEAVIEYSLFKREVQNRHSKNAMKTDGLVLKAKKHLSAIGWEFFLQQRRGGKKELRYKSPSGRTFYSLLTACEWCVTEREFSPCNAYTCEKMKQTLISGKEVFQLTFKDSSPPPIDMESERHLHDYLSKKLLTESSSSTSLPKQLVQQGEVKVHGTRTRQRKRKCGSPLLEEIKECQASVKERDDVDAEISACELRSSKRARQVIVSSSTHQTPRTVLSWLIDGNVVLPRAKVQYRSKKDGRPMKEGKITREGIKCSCCQKVFTLSKFEAHAGSNYHRPAANIFLEDGRSLLDCQLELNRQDNVRKRSEPLEVKGNQHCNANDNICSVCHYGGELVLCDKCPSSFHTSCLGLKEVPDGDWFCPSCCCGICGLSRFSENKEQLADDRLLNCGQCEHQYHIGCLRSKGLVELNYYPEGTWFCNKRCEQIHLGLHDLLGKLIPVGHDNLTWTLLKYKKAEDADQDALNNENLMESCSKLNVALSVMHECFEPVKEPRTRRDLVEDVIFNRWSELNRLNFQGFYTVVLERNDELITVATVRVYGEKVAEIPLVATRFQYRRLGMCRILMNELEKKLMGLGVERLVLPAVTSVLKTWETSFRFSIMKKSERLNFLDCTFLDFQGTVMCQKLLKDIPSTEISLLSTEVQQKVSDHINKNYLDLEGNSAVSQVFQADHVEESEIVNQGNADVLREIGSNTGNLSAPPVSVVNQTPHVDFLSCHNDITRQYSLDVTGHRQPRGTSNKIFKCYKRRRIASCGS